MLTSLKVHDSKMCKTDAPLFLCPNLWNPTLSFMQCPTDYSGQLYSLWEGYTKSMNTRRQWLLEAILTPVRRHQVNWIYIISPHSLAPQKLRQIFMEMLEEQACSMCHGRRLPDVRPPPEAWKSWGVDPGIAGPVASLNPSDQSQGMNDISSFRDQQ